MVCDTARANRNKSKSAGYTHKYKIRRVRILQKYLPPLARVTRAAAGAGGRSCRGRRRRRSRSLARFSHGSARLIYHRRGTSGVLSVPRPPSGSRPQADRVSSHATDFFKLVAFALCFWHISLSCCAAGVIVFSAYWKAIALAERKPLTTAVSFANDVHSIIRKERMSPLFGNCLGCKSIFAVWPHKAVIYASEGGDDDLFHAILLCMDEYNTLMNHFCILPDGKSKVFNMWPMFQVWSLRQICIIYICTAIK